MKSLKIISLFIVSCCISTFYAQPNYPPCTAFDSNGKDTLRAINSHSNSLYAGIDNYIEINKKNIPYKNLIVECERGMAMEDEGMYFVIPSKPGYTMINVYEYDHGDTNLVFKKAMKVNSFPQPYVVIDDMKITDYKYLSKDKITKSSRLNVHLSEDFVDDSEWYRIKEIIMGYPVGQQYKTISSEGDTLSDEMLQAIKKMMQGKELSFTFTLEGSGGLFKRLPPIRIRIY